jgi:NADH-quinone oxidoreductase subunit L
MLIPLAVLALGSVRRGVVWYEAFFGHHYLEWFGASLFFHPENHVIHDAHEVPAWVRGAPFFAMLIGLGLAYAFYVARPETPGAIARANPALYRFLLNKWYFDDLYDRIIVRPALALGRTFWKAGDGATIDGGHQRPCARLHPLVTRLAGRAQSGYVFHYAFAMVVGLIVLTLWLLLRSFG